MPRDFFAPAPIGTAAAVAPTASEFANPFLACLECGSQVRRRMRGSNSPCLCTSDFASICATWSPVGGCRCTTPHDYPVNAWRPPWGR
ncbi:MAG: hypothetical protein ABWY93_04735 [Mycobacterium sp.]